MKKCLVILDNGHGNNTPGKRSPVWSDKSQLFEYEFNRDVVQRLSILLNAKGISSHILVPELTDISLEERVNRANKVYSKFKPTHSVFLLSIHANAGGGTGWEAFTTKGETESDKIAECLYKSASSFWKDKKIRKDVVDGDLDKEENFYIIKNTICPAVLTENFFMDTEVDCSYIMSKQGRDDVAKVHLDGVISYLSSL